MGRQVVNHLHGTILSTIRKEGTLQPGKDMVGQQSGKVLGYHAQSLVYQAVCMGGVGING